MRPSWLILCIVAGLWGCGSSPSSSGGIDTTGTTPRTDTSGVCTTYCDASTPSFPRISGDTAWGDVTTYGGTDTALASSGGACNYGATGIRFYAAIQVNRLPDDLRGQWNGGKACGQGVKVRARTGNGWKETFVRIMDKCPDGYCGIDLGGAPAAALMGTQAGRYSGEWTFVSCKGHPELFDAPPHLHTKDGTNEWWSLVQVRDGWTAVARLSYRLAPDSAWREMPWATEAENFFKVPVQLLSWSDSVDIRVEYVDSSTQQARLAARDFQLEMRTYPLD